MSLTTTATPAPATPATRTPCPGEAYRGNLGSFAYVNNTRVEIIAVNSFGGVAHYGFTTVEAMRTGRNLTGWIPCELVSGLELTA